MTYLQRILAVSAATAVMLAFCTSPGSAQSRSMSGNWVFHNSGSQGRLGVTRIADTSRSTRGRT